MVTKATKAELELELLSTRRKQREAEQSVKALLALNDDYEQRWLNAETALDVVLNRIKAGALG